MENGFEGASIEELVRCLSVSKSGKDIEALLNFIRDRVVGEPLTRSAFFENKKLLNLFISSFLSRRGKKMAASTRKRFQVSDSLTIQIILTWENIYGSQYPVFASWVAYQRSRGIDIPNIREIQNAVQEVDEMTTARLVSEQRAVCKDIQRVLSELESLIEIFTPSLEEAFGDLNPETNQTHVASSSSHEDGLAEVEGVNDELFQSAREKFNYLTRKLVPRLTSLVTELEKSGRGKPGRHKLDSVTATSTYRNMLLLLSSREQGSSKRRRKDEDREYDEWF